MTENNKVETVHKNFTNVEILDLLFSKSEEGFHKGLGKATSQADDIAALKEAIAKTNRKLARSLSKEDRARRIEAMKARLERLEAIAGFVPFQNEYKGYKAIFSMEHKGIGITVICLEADQSWKLETDFVKRFEAGRYFKSWVEERLPKSEAADVQPVTAVQAKQESNPPKSELTNRQEALDNLKIDDKVLWLPKQRQGVYKGIQETVMPFAWVQFEDAAPVPINPLELMKVPDLKVGDRVLIQDIGETGEFTIAEYPAEGRYWNWALSTPCSPPNSPRVELPRALFIDKIIEILPSSTHQSLNLDSGDAPPLPCGENLDEAMATQVKTQMFDPPSIEPQTWIKLDDRDEEIRVSLHALIKELQLSEQGVEQTTDVQQAEITLAPPPTDRWKLGWQPGTLIVPNHLATKQCRRWCEAAAVRIKSVSIAMSADESDPTADNSVWLIREDGDIFSVFSHWLEEAIVEEVAGNVVVDSSTDLNQQAPAAPEAATSNDSGDSKISAPGLHISFGYTVNYLDKKTVTRRNWKDSHAQKFIKAYQQGKSIKAFDKDPRYGGVCIGILKLTQEPFKQSLRRLSLSDLEAEGGMCETIEDFVLKYFDGEFDKEVWVVNFKFSSNGLWEKSLDQGEVLEVPKESLRAPEAKESDSTMEVTLASEDNEAEIYKKYAFKVGDRVLLQNPRETKIYTIAQYPYICATSTLDWGTALSTAYDNRPVGRLLPCKQLTKIDDTEAIQEVAFTSPGNPSDNNTESKASNRRYTPDNILNLVFDEYGVVKNVSSEIIQESFETDFNPLPTNVAILSKEEARDVVCKINANCDRITGTEKILKKRINLLRQAIAV